MSKKFIILVVSIAVLLAGGAFGFQQYYIRQPKYSLKCLADACRDHDLQAFQKYVAIDDIVSRAVDDVLSLAMEKELSKNKTEMEQVGAALGAGIVQLIKPKLVQQAKDEVKKAVEAGNLFKLQPGDAASTQNPENNTPVITLNDIRKDGKVAYADISLKNATSVKPINLKVLMRDMGDYWQVASISNLKDIVAEVQNNKN